MQRTNYEFSSFYCNGEQFWFTQITVVSENSTQYSWKIEFLIENEYFVIKKYKTTLVENWGKIVNDWNLQGKSQNCVFKCWRCEEQFIKADENVKSRLCYGCNIEWGDL